MPLDTAPEPTITDETPAPEAAPDGSSATATATTPSPNAGEGAESDAASGAEEPAVDGVQPEKKDETKKPEEKPPGWKAVEAAKREQVRLAQRRDEVTSRESKLAEREQHFESQVRQFNAVAQQFQQREARLHAFERAIETGDVETLERHFKLNYQTLTARAVEAQDPNGRIARLEREREEERRQAEHARVTNEQIAEAREVAQTLVDYVEQGAAQYPDLYTWPPERIAMEGLALRDDIIRQTRRSPSYRDVMAHLQKRAKAEADHAAQKRNAPQQQRGGATSNAGSTGQADPRATSSRATTTPTLSAKDAVVKATPPRELTEAEKDEMCLAELRNLKKR